MEARGNFATPVASEPYAVRYIALGAEGVRVIEPIPLLAQVVADGVLLQTATDRCCIIYLRSRDGVKDFTQITPIVYSDRYLDTDVRAGDLLEVSEPRNNFRLVEGATRYLFIAGGVGVTPIMAMVTHLRANGASFMMHYCARSAERAAFRDRLGPLEREGQMRFHFDGGDPKRGLDVAGLLARHEPGNERGQDVAERPDHGEDRESGDHDQTGVDQRRRFGQPAGRDQPEL